MLKFHFYFEITNLTQHLMKVIGQPPFGNLSTTIENNQYQEFTAVLHPNQSIDLECQIQDKSCYKFQFTYRKQKRNHQFACQYHYPLGYEAIIVTNLIHPKFQIDITCRPLALPNLLTNGKPTK
ncbi:hypothetical protein MNBD_CHLOROFLEXI01-3796 [hydrothermal vent metagenome]|uniref:Uncharacterized protein n=1 Tax=hydrothermal vent metagenome TaxID=652676 RepID=A0A3B0UL75_9ZZZZ